MTALFHIFPAIVLQSQNPDTTMNPAMLEDSILIPSICIIMLVVMVAGIAITVQKHKRY